MISVLFVCLGNICRSPLAEGICRHLAKEQGLIGQDHAQDRLVIDSCGTGDWHIGAPPHIESQNVAFRHGISLDGIHARQLLLADFQRFDFIIAMDQQNLMAIQEIARQQRRLSETDQQIKLLRDFDPNGSGDVPDPYYGGIDDFAETFEIIYRSTVVLLQTLQTKIS